jgi:hypothetical protein
MNESSIIHHPSSIIHHPSSIIHHRLSHIAYRISHIASFGFTGTVPTFERYAQYRNGFASSNLDLTSASRLIVKHHLETNKHTITGSFKMMSLHLSRVASPAGAVFSRDDREQNAGKFAFCFLSIYIDE